MCCYMAPSASGSSLRRTPSTCRPPAPSPASTPTVASTTKARSRRRPTVCTHGPNTRDVRTLPLLLTSRVLIARASRAHGSGHGGRRGGASNTRGGGGAAGGGAAVTRGRGARGECQRIPTRSTSLTPIYTPKRPHQESLTPMHTAVHRTRDPTRIYTLQVAHSSRLRVAGSNPASRSSAQ